jgi:hypothetical protein
MQRRVLLLSPHFPPSTLAGVHRARHLAKHLPAAGWQPTVLCVDEAHHTERLDPELARLLPRDLDVVKTGAWPPGLMRLAGIGDIGLRAYRHLGAALAETVKSRRIDVVFITGSPYYPMLLARIVKKRFGVPVVLDFQDPWVSAWGATQPRLSKAGLSHALATSLEPVAVRHADFITSVSETQNVAFLARYPWFDRAHTAALPIGGDPDDYAVLRAQDRGAGEVTLDADAINFSYVGTALPRAAPLLSQLFAALRMLRAGEPQLAARLRFNFVGTSNQPGGFGDYRIRPLAEAHGVADLVSETPQRVPYLEALGVLAKSDVILLIGSDEPHYTASKIYPGLLSGRPCLGLFHRASSAFDILARSGGAIVLGFATPDELAGLTGALARAIGDLARDPTSVGTVRRAAIEPYGAGHIARQFAAIFAGLVQ